MLKLAFPVILWGMLRVSSADGSTCGKLVRCTVKRCFSRATKCRDACTACEQCNYALEQLTKITSGVKTKMLCPKIETCLEQCFSEDPLQINTCARLRCNIYCYDDDCPHCIYVGKRIFLKICHENNIPSLPNVKFDGSCMDLFDYVLKEYAAGRRT